MLIMPIIHFLIELMVTVKAALEFKAVIVKHDYQHIIQHTMKEIEK